MRLHSPVDLTGNVNMIEKLVLGGLEPGGLPILSPLTSVPVISYYNINQITISFFLFNTTCSVLQFQNGNKIVGAMDMNMVALVGH